MAQIHIVYYIFVNNQQKWVGSVKGQIDDIISSGLLRTAQLHLCLSGDTKVMNDAKLLIDKLLCGIKTDPLDYSFVEQNQYEYPGIHKLYTLAKDNPTHFFVYLHTKGVSRSMSSADRSIDNIYLTKLTLWNHEKVLSVFNNNPKINKIGFFPSTGGWIWFNFFWVRGTYLASCLEPIVSPRRHYYEDWLGTSGKTGISDCYCLYNDTISASFSPHDACKTIAQLYTTYKFIVINPTISKVSYGVNDQVVDVTDNFCKLIEQNKTVNVNNTLVGKDPCYGVHKQLVIQLQNGQKYEFYEGSTILLAIP